MEVEPRADDARGGGQPRRQGESVGPGVGEVALVDDDDERDAQQLLGVQDVVQLGPRLLQALATKWRIC